MSNDSTPDDGTESTTDHQPTSKTEQPRSRSADTQGGRSRRGFLTGTAALGVTAITGLSTETASAQTDSKEITVASSDGGSYYYEIHLEDIADSVGNPSIERSSENPPLSLIIPAPNSGDRHEMVRGLVPSDHQKDALGWEDHAYRYTGEIDHIVAHGEIDFRFPDGAFRTADDDRIQIDIRGLESGKNSYHLAARPGNIDKVDRVTGSKDLDLFGPDSERADTTDMVAGSVWNNNRDSHLLRAGDIHGISANGGLKIEVDDL